MATGAGPRPMDRRTASARSARAGAARSLRRRKGALATAPPRVVALLRGLTVVTVRAWHGPRARVRACGLSSSVPAPSAGWWGRACHQQGLDVTLIARGAHAEALSAGLVLETPAESVTLSIPVVTEPAAVKWTSDTIVLLGVKGQQTEQALAQLVARRSVRHPHRLHAERRGERAPCPAALPQHLRHVRVVPGHPSEAGRDSGPFRSGQRTARSRSLSPRGRRHGSDHGRRAECLHLPVGGAVRHHALEVPQAPPEPLQRGGRPLWARGPRQPPGQGGAAGRRGGVGGGGDPGGDGRGGSCPPGRSSPAAQHHIRRVERRIELAEPGPRDGVDRGGVPER